MIMSNVPTGNRPAVSLPLGQVVSTPGALDALAKAGQNGQEFIDRHRRGTGPWLRPPPKRESHHISPRDLRCHTSLHW